jgi:hypothetical protein
VGRAEVVGGWEKIRERRMKAGRSRKLIRDLGRGTGAKDLVKSPLMELFTIQANPTKSRGKFMEQFKSQPLHHRHFDRTSRSCVQRINA